MDVLARLDETRAANNVLEHPFYARWVAGGLSAEELARYSAQYRRAVVALADASLAAAEAAGPADAEGLGHHAEEERAHVGLWDSFAAACARAAGREDAEAPEAPGTAACVASWTAGESLLERLAVLYAIEASQPEISRTKLEGLRAHYPYVEEGPATDYFSLHQLRDVEHAEAAAELISELIALAPDPEAQQERMLMRAEAALRGNWELLDSVEAGG
jgi:pyrroloquinoline-quinone synthase